MELNGDIVRQLYGEISSKIKPSGKSYRSHIRHLPPARPSCLKAFYSFFAVVDKALPNYKLLLDNIVVRENKVLTRYTISGKPKGEFMGLAVADEQMTIKGIDVFRLDGGKIAEYWDSAHQINLSHSKPRNCPGRWRLEGNGITFQRKQPSLSA